ncbi:MAG: type II toxin-antitoxin system VapC family toxin [Gammaproteobacteria bacterium]|nr:type II toxin-antitoxin system VapC family toxin [Gammaproteobacteria bacterium]
MSRLLLDTHVVLWWLTDEGRLREEARQAIAAGRNEVLVSAVTGWEIAIKRALGKLRAPDDMELVVEDAGFGPLPLLFRHAERAGSLPMHHRDPFDRMLVAQAQIEGLVLVTRDERLSRYEVETLAA